MSSTGPRNGANRRRSGRRLYLGLAAVCFTAFLLVSLFPGGGSGEGEGRGGQRTSAAHDVGHHEEDDNYELPAGILTDPPTIATPPSGWVNNEASNIYNSPRIIPAETLRKLLDVAFIGSIKRRRRTYSRQRFPAVDAEFHKLLNMSLLLQHAAADKEGGGGTAEIAYIVGKAKALLTSLRATLGDTMDDRVEDSYHQGSLASGRPPGITRFILLELAETRPCSPDSAVSPAAGGDVLLLPLLRDLLAPYGTLRVMSVSTASAAEGKGESGNAFWAPYVQSHALASALREAAPREEVARRGSEVPKERHCFSDLASDDGAKSDGAVVAIPPITGAFKLQEGVIKGRESITPLDAAADKVRWSHLSGVPSPFHEMLRVRALGATAGGNATQQAADRHQERRLAQVIHSASAKTEERGGWRWGRRAGATVDTRAIAQIAKAMRPMVDVQIISSFTGLYNRMVRMERQRRQERSDGGGGGSARTASTAKPKGEVVQPDYLSHFLLGEQTFAGDQADFEAFLVFLLSNAREATYLELPNLFACDRIPNDTEEEEGKKEGERASAGAIPPEDAVNKGSGGAGTYNLTERLVQWYITPLLRGRTRREKSADGKYNPDFLLGLGAQARPESKNRRVSSMANLFEAILASYGILSDMSIAFEEPTMGFCFPGSTAVAAARGMVRCMAPGKREAVGNDVEPLPRVVIRFAPDRLQLMKERKKQPLLERMDCLSLPT